MRRTTAKIVCMISLALLSACATEPDRTGELPTAPAAFKEATPTQASAPALPTATEGEWWTIFGDPVLDALVARANRHNWTIRLAKARLAQARAKLDAAEAARAPLLGTGVSTSRKEGPLTNEAASTGTLYVGAINLSYEVDLFGRMARQAEAESLDAGDREALLRWARLVTQADVAQTYFSLRALDAERSLLRDAAASQREALRLMRGLVTSGLSAELTATRMQAESGAIEADLRAAERRRAELEHTLALLVGEAPAGFGVDEAPWTPVAPEIPAGIPASVLARRPDVAAAQQGMAAAQKRAGIARDAWLPSLSLTSAGGFASAALTTLLSGSSGALGIAALLAMPLIDGGRHDAEVARADAEVDVSLARHGQQILVALKDVEDQLSALRTLRGEAAALERAGEASARATRLVESNHRNGLASELEIISARRTELRTRRQALQARAGRVHATVGLVRALGGGWDGINEQVRAR